MAAVVKMANVAIYLKTSHQIVANHRCEVIMHAHEKYFKTD